LVAEAAHELRPAAVLLQQHLDRQLAAQLGVAALEDRAHAAAADLPQQLVLAKATRRSHAIIDGRVAVRLRRHFAGSRPGGGAPTRINRSWLSKNVRKAPASSGYRVSSCSRSGGVPASTA